VTAHAWVIGARGLLGRAATARLGTDPRWSLIDGEPLPWHDDSVLAATAHNTAQRLVRGSAEGGGPWAVFWAAGTAVTSSPPDVMATELRQMGLVLSVIARATVDEGSTGPGCVFFASSAGGVYGGSSRPPFDEHTTPAPISPYGRFKLDAERLLESFTRQTGISTAVGRIANLYGPGQSLDKMQGLITHLARAQYSATPASLYVPLDTLRDYVYVDDCAALIGDLVLRAIEEHERSGPLHVVKNVISGQSVSISALLGYFRTLAKGHPHVMLASSTAAALQAIDLRLASVQWPELDVREYTPLPAGIHATMADILARVQAGGHR
jgi:UDP-glucose 4-epimerase